MLVVFFIGYLLLIGGIPLIREIDVPYSHDKFVKSLRGNKKLAIDYLENNRLGPNDYIRGVHVLEHALQKDSGDVVDKLIELGADPRQSIYVDSSDSIIQEHYNNLKNFIGDPTGSAAENRTCEMLHEQVVSLVEREQAPIAEAQVKPLRSMDSRGACLPNDLLGLLQKKCHNNLVLEEMSKFGLK